MSKRKGLNLYQRTDMHIEIEYRTERFIEGIKNWAEKYSYKYNVPAQQLYNSAIKYVKILFK